MLGLEPYVDEPCYVGFNLGDVGGGKLVATVRDGDGNITGLVQSP